MRGQATFAEIFEATLNCTDVPHARGAWSRPLTTPLFVFEPVSIRGRAEASASADPRTLKRALYGDSKHDVELPRPAVRVASVVLGRDVPPATQRIALSPLERRSLAALNALGAGLDERLSPSTLRRAFRRLARRYHPDRHPGSSAAEEQRLARVFVEATEHYRVLVSALAAHARST